MVVLNWLKENYKGMLVGAIIVGLIAGVAWPKREAKLQDGKEVAVETRVAKYTAEKLYDALKEKNGLTVLLTELDRDIINDKYGTSLDEEARESATTEAESYINQYSLYYSMDEETFLSQNGFKDREDFIQNLMTNYKMNHYVNEYIANSLSEDDLKSYYNSSVFGDKVVTLISSTTSEADVKKAQKELKNGTSLEKVKSKYSGLVFNDLTMTYDQAYSYPENVVKIIMNMSAKQVSDVINDSTYGYLTIYVTSSKDKPSYEDAKEGIKNSIAQQKQTDDQTLYYKALIELRNEYGIKFYDASYEKYYTNFNKQYAGQ